MGYFRGNLGKVIHHIVLVGADAATVAVEFLIKKSKEFDGDETGETASRISESDATKSGNARTGGNESGKSDDKEYAGMKTGGSGEGVSDDMLTDTVGAFCVTGGTFGIDYIYSGNTLTVLTDTPITVRNIDPSIPATDRIVIQSDVNSSITLAGVNIDKSASGWAAFTIEDDSAGNVTVTLADGTSNILISGSDCAGLQKKGGTVTGTLTIQGSTGSLTAQGGAQGAGIGGGAYGSAGNITITGGTVTATGGYQGAGIGGGAYGSASDIAVTGGMVTATGGYLAAGIGGGASDSGNNIIITCETVTAVAGYDADEEIGSGWLGGTGSSLVIQGDKGEVRGNVTLKSDITIDENVELEITNGSKLTVARGVTLTNNGKIHMPYDKTLANRGTIAGRGIVTGYKGKANVGLYRIS